MKVTPVWIAITFLSLLLADVCHALEPVEFGPEFTFANSNKNMSETTPQLGARMYRHLVEGQARFEQFEANSLSAAEPYRNQFESPNGWWFRIVLEGGPSGVVEVKVKHGTVDYFRQNKADMQDAIFASAANEDLYPALFRGGGHINVNANAFENNSLLLRNFLVDLINQNELFMGVFNYDTHNALPFQLLSQSSQNAVREVIKNFDKGAFENGRGYVDQEAFMDAVQHAQNKSEDDFLVRWFPPIPERTRTDDFSGLVTTPKRDRNKYHAVNLNHSKIRRVEIRGVRPQASMDVWIRQIDLIEHRLQYLEKIKTPIPVATLVPMQTIDIEGRGHDLNPPVDPQQALRAFYRFVTESGLRWQDHNDYLWPKWVSDGELKKFEKSLWFRWKERRQSCLDQLAVG